MTLLSIGVVSTSLKDNDRRVAIHPDHLGQIPEQIRKYLYFEQGYGVPFGMKNDTIASMTGGLLSRDGIFENCDIVLLPKPMQDDFNQMKENGILWGWAHCVQKQAFTQTAIDRRLTLIAWEAMNLWGQAGQWQMHCFYKNNEIAGYAGVIHALGLIGIDGCYGPCRKVVVINFGSVSRGAIYALKAHGFSDITVFTQLPPHEVADQVVGVSYSQMKTDGSGALLAVNPDGSTDPFIKHLEDADIIVNGILQDPDRPLMFVQEDEAGRLKSGCLIIDISCDEGMGFPFAVPTDFENPVLEIGDIRYYAVDHIPSYLWNSASWEISKSLIPFLPVVMGDQDQWDKNETIRRAIEIRSGVIQNPKILSFQNRLPEYPHDLNSK